MKKMLFSIPILMALTGCGSDIDIVKNGVMEFNKTTTLGQALDNWKSCEKKEWKSFKTDNGVKVVQFSCHHKVAEYMSKVKSSLSQEKQSEAVYMDIVSNVQTFQFTINKDDTFQIDNVKVESVWADGSDFKASQEPVEQLESAYKNELNFDPSEVNWLSSIQIASTFKSIKPQAEHTEKAHESAQRVDSQQQLLSEQQSHPIISPALATPNSTLSLGPSFACEKASTLVEKSICSDALLGKLDGALSANYKSMFASDIGDGAREELKKSQRNWLVERNICTNNQCIIDAYRKRVDEICDYPVISGAHPTCTHSDDIKQF